MEDILILFKDTNGEAAAFTQYNSDLIKELKLFFLYNFRFDRA